MIWRMTLPLVPLDRAKATGLLVVAVALFNTGCLVGRVVRDGVAITALEFLLNNGAVLDLFPEPTL